MTEASQVPSTTDDDRTPSTPGAREAAVGPFTLRELAFGGGVALTFIGTLLPFVDNVIRTDNLWSTAPLFFLGIGILLPVIAGALLAARRLGSTGLRVGSLSVDQFASVSAVLAATFFFLQTATAFHLGPFLALIGSLVMLAATVVAPFLPGLKDDFANREEVPAHYLARPMVPVKRRTPAPEPKTADQAGADVVAPKKERVKKERKTATGINPAAAPTRQNGAGLYGSGGAGAVHAGQAVAGQSGLASDARQDGPEADVAGASRLGGGASAAVPSSTDRPSTTVTPSSDEDTMTGEDVASTPSGSDEQTGSSAAEIGETRVHEQVLPTEASARNRQEPISATRNAAEEEPVVEAFWFAVGSSRPVVDEQNGLEVFTLEPGDWEVGIEDRGDEFLVQDKRTGAVGVLRDLRNIERAPRD